ncbi:hypothetical protein RHMOL_Rhmol09G0002100 [Rhododendron molle]|uniref:Uncharacterized protein n=1 Tax=Rhododendron molle TaxID=49168 RepID=A0ACC0M8B4_RHOML|nr:hypothetical protein RHMOL_Rhmol09G0002100 [Rhododendron molle]
MTQTAPMNMRTIRLGCWPIDHGRSPFAVPPFQKMNREIYLCYILAATIFRAGQGRSLEKVAEANSDTLGAGTLGQM